MICDTMYSLADSVSMKEDWGHSSNIVAIDLCHGAQRQAAGAVPPRTDLLRCRHRADARRKRPLRGTDPRAGSRWRCCAPMTALKSASDRKPLRGSSRSLWLAALAASCWPALLSLALGRRANTTRCSMAGSGWPRATCRKQRARRRHRRGKPGCHRQLAMAAQHARDDDPPAGRKAARRRSGSTSCSSNPTRSARRDSRRLYAPDRPRHRRRGSSGLESMDGDFADAISTAPVVLGRAGVQLGGADPATLTQWATITGTPPASLPRYPVVQTQSGSARIARAGLWHAQRHARWRWRGARAFRWCCKTGEALVPGLALELVRVAMEQRSGSRS